MQVLPVNDIFQITNTPIILPEKRKSGSDSEVISKPSKKKAATMKTTKKRVTRRAVAEADPSSASGSKTDMQIDTV
jgi:hypothetical protein